MRGQVIILEKYIVFLSLEIDFVLANNADPAEMPHNAAFHLGLHFCQSTRLGVSGLQRVMAVILLFIHSSLMLPSYVVFCVWSLFCNIVVIILTSFAIIVLRKRELVTLLYLCSCCCVGIYVLCLFLTLPKNGL